MPTQVSPTQNIVNKNIYKHIVPHIHPTHTTTVNDHIYQNQHYFPHTQSVVNTCKSENVFCQQPMMCPPSPCHMPYGKFY
ncbi:CotD family spore coat protein [Bacillus sp. JJ722]